MQILQIERDGQYAVYLSHSNMGVGEEGKSGDQIYACMSACYALEEARRNLISIFFYLISTAFRCAFEKYLTNCW